MRYLHFLLFLAWSVQLSALPLNRTDFPSRYGKVKVYIFLLEDCVISQAYTNELRRLHQSYSSEQIQFEGRFPNTMSSDSTVKVFKEIYNIPFDLKYTPDKDLAKKFNVLVTPEVVVYSETNAEVLYQGRIDNLYFQPGKKKIQATTSELKDALECILHEKDILVNKTEAIGCVLNYFK